MTCRCTANSLQIFIRSVAQVDLPSATRLSSTIRCPKPSIRHPGLAIRSYSSQPLSEPNYVAFKPSPSSDPQYAKPESASLNNSIDIKLPERYSGTDAIAEFSLDAVESIAAEAAAGNPYKVRKEMPTQAVDGSAKYETPLKILLDEVPQRQTRPTKPWMDVPAPATQMTSLKDKTAFWTRETSKTPFTKTKSGNARILHFGEPPKREVKSKSRVDDWVPPPREPWMVYKEALKKKFPNGYKPLKRLSPDAISGIRSLYAQMPEHYTVDVLSNQFEISPDAIRRILKSKWVPTPEEQMDRERRWVRRGESVWNRYYELGLSPPKKWREKGVGKPEEKVQPFRYTPPALPELITTSHKQEFMDEDGEAESTSLANRIL